MPQISEYVDFDDDTNKVRYSCEEEWYEISNIQTFTKKFYEAAEAFVNKHGTMCSSIIEESAFATALSMESDE